VRKGLITELAVLRATAEQALALARLAHALPDPAAEGLAAEARRLADAVAALAHRLQRAAGVAAVSQSGRPTEGWR
jgi:hypothetical protein